MTLHDFYDALDNELNEVIADNPQDVRLHKGDESTRKSFAFLIWFMKFYGKRPVYNLSNGSSGFINYLEKMVAVTEDDIEAIDWKAYFEV